MEAGIVSYRFHVSSNHHGEPTGVELGRPFKNCLELIKLRVINSEDVSIRYKRVQTIPLLTILERFKGKKLFTQKF